MHNTYFGEFRKFGLGLHKKLFDDEGNIKKHSYLFWDIAAFRLCMVFQKHSRVHFGVWGFFNNGSPTC